MNEGENFEQSDAPVLSESELRNISQYLLSQTEFGINLRLKQIAKEKNSTPEEILKEINQFKIATIREREKGEKRHFHRTSIDALKIIAEIGRLVSRSKLKEERPDIKIPGWSSNDNVMMTRDSFDEKGNLINPGFSDKEVVGASGKGVILVMREDIMNSDNYDISSHYPTVSDLPLEGYCETILAESDKDKEEVEKILEENNISIHVLLKSKWTRD